MKQSFFDGFKDWLKITIVVFFGSGFWFFFPPIIALMSVYCLYHSFWSFLPCAASYLAWFIYSYDWPERGGMKSDSTSVDNSAMTLLICNALSSEFFRRNLFFAKWAVDYFDYTIVKTAEIPADKNYIAGCHPHGIGCIGLGLYYVAQTPETYPGIDGYAVGLAGHFLFPLKREMMMWGGMGAASKRFLSWAFGSEKKGNLVIIVIGGLNEAIISRPGKYYIKLLDRKGFVRVALTEGADLVPAFNFGENETYNQATGMCPKRLRNAQAHMINMFGFCPPFPIGRSLLGLPWGGFVPIKTRITSVIGAPIRVEKNPNPTDEEVDQLHATYCEKLMELFEAHKATYGSGADEKIILY